MQRISPAAVVAVLDKLASLVRRVPVAVAATAPLPASLAQRLTTAVAVVAVRRQVWVVMAGSAAAETAHLSVLQDRSEQTAWEEEAVVAAMCAQEAKAARAL